ncbi:NADPH-dependent FMN reductase [Bartonella gabonensis]|uniref:NADPH-dependent FMN reductase n=1 Tax=Bartonella gabonensis TaxID=2699889 RepID=UPI001FE96226|nr:NAD(P)H-dependent oxidoreductase [Bartonella gabonensis]
MASPLYQGSYSGVFKNALDHLTYNAFLNKPVGLIFHGSTIQNVHNRVRIYCRSVRTPYGYGTLMSNSLFQRGFYLG